ncbi:MAG TPA: adenylate/guanylate cyclase domain-containing protein [Solirubrobacterales bacterium]|nr:adenylate/guanylate cyclase domain-containing protein [Solirubrobacterales bacterium]
MSKRNESLDAERKQVTVLFADVMGSMDLAEQHDPEAWRKIMQRFFSILADAVTEFEGTVDKFTGDGIMAVFGAPVAHEDHARRACYAALRMLDDVSGYAAELRREEGLNFSVRIGVNSGEVVAGAIGDAVGGDYTAIGHTVGLAQRMEALAEPGKAYLTEHTAALAEGFLELEDLGEFEIKGASLPVRVFELAGIGKARSRLDLSRERGFSRFVGRTEEMGALEDGLARAERGEGSVVGIAAEPGAGKSRLCHEFAERCREAELEVFEAQAQAHGRSIPFMPVLQMLRAYFGIDDREPERAAREKIAGRTLLLDPAFADDLPLLFDFLGVPDPDRPPPQLSGEARQRALRGIVCRLVNTPARRHTIVIVVEDLHWIDEGSEAMLADLVGAVGGTPTLVVVNFRPEYTPSWQALPSYRSVSLDPLGAADTREMLRDIAGEDPSLDGLEEPVHERAAGNPFFIEEIVRELAETGRLEGERGAYRLAGPVEDAAVPASVQAILAARIDRLEPAAKQLLQVASVLGREFGERALRLSAGIEAEELSETLRSLVEAGFLYEAELYPERVLAFRHPLTREVAYSTQLGERRAATHAAVARATIEIECGRLDELAALVAHHWEEGAETLEAARWYARAAYWAGHSRPQDALRLWQQVTRLVGGLEETEETAALAVFSRLQQLDYAWRLGMDRELAESLAEEAGEVAGRTGDLRSLALLRLLTGARPGVAHDASEWIEAAEEAIALADESGDLDLRAGIRAPHCYAYLCAGDFERALETIDEMIELGDGDPTVGAGVVIGCIPAWGLMAKSLALKEMGRADEAEACADESLQLAGEHGDLETESWSRGSKASLLSDRGESEAALALARRNCELTEQLGDVFSRSMALNSLAYVELGAGEYEAALASIELSDRSYREAMNSGGEGEAWRSTLRARALLGIGRVEDAIEEAHWAADTSRTRGMLWQLPSSLHVLAQALAATGSPGAEEALDEATDVCERLGHNLTLSRIEADRATLTGARA